MKEGGQVKQRECHVEPSRSGSFLSGMGPNHAEDPRRFCVGWSNQDAYHRQAVLTISPHGTVHWDCRGNWGGPGTRESVWHSMSRGYYKDDVK